MNRAFTLIELLVVVALLSLLIAIILPVLSNTREVGRDVACKSRLNQMNTGWRAVLADTDYRIPETHRLTLPPGPPTQSPTNQRWDALLTDTLALPAIDGQRARFVCPTARNAYNSIQNTAGRTTYGINVRWAPGSAAGDNERQSFDQIFSPAAYPLFADTDALRLGKDEFIYDEFGLQGNFQPSPDWQLGFFHAQDTVNIAFADGHVESQTRDILNGAVDENGVPLFFFNRARAFRLAAVSITPTLP